MILNLGKKKLNCLQVVQENSVNNIYICEEISSIKTYVTVWEIKERTVAKALLECGEYSCYVYEDKIYFLFPYKEPRLIKDFYLSVTIGHSELKEKVLRECVIGCMNSKIPYPVLWLILKQRQLNIGKDGSISFGYLLNLKDFSSKKGEADCIACCAELILELLRMESKTNKVAIALLEKKKKSYSSFQELFRDICLITDASKSRNIKTELKEKITLKKDDFFRIMIWVSGILVFVALIMFFTNLFFKEMFFYQLFQSSFERIGTESLLQ